MLSKSQYIRGLQCRKSLWLYKNKSKLREQPDEASQALFSIGDTVGDYAKKLFPGGVEIEFNSSDFDGMVRTTCDAISQGVDTIYEATFKEKAVFAMADVLHKSGKSWNMYEVKASTNVKPHYIDDASVQWYALSQKIKLKKAFIIHINNQYVRQGEVDVNALFTIEDVTKEVKQNQKAIPATLRSLERMIKGQMPKIDIGQHCSDPYACDFAEHCWSHVPDVSIFNLYRMRWDKRFALYDRGILEFKDMPKDLKLNATQQRQVNAEKTGAVIVNKEIIQEFLENIVYPVSFLDFETFQNPVPRFNGQRPYMQMAFQYSLHIVGKRGAMRHHEFLGDHNSDPRRELCERMLRHLPASGSIMVYNKSFEITRIKEMAEEFKDLRGDLLALVDRFVDLVVPFRKGGYYHPDFNGSFSIKSVLPALFLDDPKLSYKNLNIQDGGMAMDTFANLYLLEDITLLPQIRKDLLAYCHLDTLAMVKIWQRLQDITMA